MNRTSPQILRRSHIRPLLLPALALLVAGAAVAEDVSVRDPRWHFEAQKHEIVQFREREALYLENGKALVEGVELRDGMIQFDVAFDGRRGFSGGLWRIRDSGNAEEFYLRPHQSGNPDATQYTPIFNGLTAWQLYHGPRYALPVTIDMTGWNHVRILFRGGEAKITVNGETLFVDELKREPEAGGVGLVASFAPAWFSDFRVTSADLPEIRGTAASPRLAPQHPVRAWHVSSTFPEELVAGAAALPATLPGDLTWQRVEAESTGLLNLSRWSALTREANTVLVRLPLVAGEAATQPIRFGFSDRVRVFLNGQMLFVGNDGYQSRDYRYLGTIGLFDTVFLPLRKGKNELLFAVSESFGGWGLIADLETVEGVAVGIPPDPPLSTGGG